jgi:hypothetical protein
MQPSRKTRPQIEPAKVAVSAQEGLLDHVFGFLLVARHAISQTKDGPAVAFDERAKRLLVARAHPRHHRGVAFFHHPIHTPARPNGWVVEVRLLGPVVL